LVSSIDGSAKNRLKPPLQGRVFFDVFLIFLQGRGADGFSVRPRAKAGLSKLGSINCAIGRARAHQSVQFIDKRKYSVPLRARLPATML